MVPIQIVCNSTNDININSSICYSNESPCGWGVEYAHRIPACRIGRLKGCPDGSASISAGLHRYPVYLLPGCRLKTLLKFSNFSCQIPTQPLLHMVHMFMTGLHHSPVVSIPLHIITNSFIFPLHLPPLLLCLMCTRVRGNYHHK